MNEVLIKLEEVSKKYNDNMIFTKLNLQIAAGECIAIIGKNGKGKSTFLRIISKLTKIDGGKITYNHKLKFNYIPESFTGLNISVSEYLSSIGEIEGMSSKDFKERFQCLIKEFGLESMVNTPMKFLSKGSLQKTSVIQALLSKPDILLLDEPLNGQDVGSQEKFIATVKELIKDGVTVIMSCHEPFLVRELASKVLKIENSMLVEVEKDQLVDEKYSLITVDNNDAAKEIIKTHHSDIISFNEEQDSVTIKILYSRGSNLLKEFTKADCNVKFYQE